LEVILKAFYDQPQLGNASIDDEEIEKFENVSKIINLRKNNAHYVGMSETEAAKVFNAETICVNCVCSPMCIVAKNIENTLTVISRCLAYVSIS
jgi:hypothetical protein